MYVVPYPVAGNPVSMTVQCFSEPLPPQRPCVFVAPPIAVTRPVYKDAEASFGPSKRLHLSLSEIYFANKQISTLSQTIFKQFVSTKIRLMHFSM